MSLTTESIQRILRYLDPALLTLETGFPTSTRPNEPALTVDQKRLKIENTLKTHPGIFLTKWGSVILYPRARPQTQQQQTTGTVSTPDIGGLYIDDTLTAKDILDLFVPLAVDYEIKYQLTRLYQQLQQIMEHSEFKARRQQSHTGPSAGSNDPENLHLHHYAPSTVNDAMMDIDATADDSVNATKAHTAKTGKLLPEEERRPVPAQNDLFTRSTLSQNTRRNRRLNYLLRYLAPPDATESQATTAAAATSASSHKGRRSSTMDQKQQHHPHPALASILSISGSMSNLSFSDSTYFSDAEMESRAPELYQQYIGRFMDNDNTDEEDDSEEDVESNATGVEADDEREEDRRRRYERANKSQPEPFGKDVGLVDRILWNIDHPTKREQKIQRQEEMDRQNQYQEGPHQGNISMEEEEVQTESVRLPVPQRHSRPQEQEQEQEFEEEFDTESDEDADQSMDQDDRRGPLRSLKNDDEILAVTSVTPPIPPDPVPGFLSSTMSSAAMTLEQPEARARFAEVENGNGLNSDNEEEDKETEKRKEDQESLRREFVLLMKQRFLDGLDVNFDYSTVDFDENLDDLDQEDHDKEDRWFDADEEGENENENEDLDLDQDKAKPRPKKTSSNRGRTPSTQLMTSPGLNYDQRVLAWESSAQNGSGDYDY
ncbi:hypothetical protein BGZ83_004643 [Gryganskiella cystojenkinii]|nr:hypothetical protein BGZ83_004643 [Gryganskiella cystojenkinii]